MPLDEQLISHSNSQKNKAGNSGNGSSSARSASLREAMRGNGANDSLESQGDLRADKMAAARNGGKSLTDKAVEEALSPAKQSLSNLLKASWENLIDSFGLTIIWIDIHIFLSYVLGKDLFCSLGEEWLPKGTPRNLESAKKYVGLTEKMGVVVINILGLVLILFVLSLVAMIVAAIDNPLKAISALFGSLWQALFH